MRAYVLFALVVSLFAGVVTEVDASEIKNIGTPLIRQYKRADFNAGRQTWMIEQGINGMMYFANNDGLLEFDGNEWKIYQLPNRTIIRCIKSDGQGRIYAGGFNEFGYFDQENSGNLVYHSMTDLLPEDKKDFGEVWRIHLTASGIVFQAFPRIVIIKDQTAEIIEAPGEFHFSYYVNGELYLLDRQEGLLRLALGKLFPVLGAQALKGKEVWGILPVDNKLLIATSGEGVYLYDGSSLRTWNQEMSDILTGSKVFCASLIGEESIAFGTIQNGLYITDLKGNIEQSVNRDQGLQNNTVLSMNTDDYGNLWLGLDNGIDYLEINSPLSLLSYHHGLNSGYAAIIHEGKLYLGTNQGVYVAEWSNDPSISKYNLSFSLIESTSGQVWTLQVIDGTLFCGHNNGTYILKGNDARLINEISGGWKYLQLKDDPDHVIGGTYSGLILFEKRNGEWAFKQRIRGFSESSRDILQDGDREIWMSHGLKGVFRIKLNTSADSVIQTDFYNSSNGLPADYGIALFNYKDSIYLTTEKGIFHFDKAASQFRKSVAVSELLGDNLYRKIVIDDKGNIWYFTDTRSGVFRIQEDGSHLDIKLPFEQIAGSFIGGFEFVYPYDNRNVFFGNENGFIHYDPAFMKDYNKSIVAFIRKVVVSNSDSVLFNGSIDRMYQLNDEIEFRNNNLQFFYSANDFENPGKLAYATFLSGFESSWSNWGPQSNREYTHLREGDYVFHVRARNIYQVESKTVSISFTVRPPWQRSFIAYLFYGLLILLAVFVVVILIRRKINRSKRQAEIVKERQFLQREEELKRVSLEAEKEVIRLRNEKLKEEMLLKDKELANSTLQMIQKNKFLSSLKEDLKQLGSISGDQELRAQIRSITKKINRDIDTESQWKVFETHFEMVHEEFLKRIKSEYPELTPGELKLCAYLRLNISSKEIALLMNISTRGVEISRYRLRKKLDLDHDTNLTDFIMSY